MFTRILSNRLVRFVSWVLIVSLAVPMFNGVFPKHAQAQEESLYTSVAVIGLDNQTVHEVETEEGVEEQPWDLLEDDYGIGQILAQATKLGIAEKEKLEFIPKDNILDSMGKSDTITEDLALSVGEAVEAEQIMFGAISNVSVSIGQTSIAHIVLEINIYDVDNQTIISKSRVLGEIERKGFSGSEEELIQLALKDGLQKSIDEAISNQYKYGVVTVVKGGTVQTNLSERDGVAKGALVAVLDGAQQIAIIEVDYTSLAYSRGDVTEVLHRSTIKSGLKTRLIYTPKEFKAELSTVDQNIRKKKRMNPLLLAIVAAAVLGSIKSGSEGAEPPQPHTGPEVRASQDGKAVVYAPNGFNSDYIPNVPTKLSTFSAINASDIGQCNTCTETGWSSNKQDVCVVKNIGYDFTMATSPQSTSIPGGYVISMDLEDVKDSLSDTQKAKLYLATCNATTKEWDLISANYSTCSWMSNNTCVYGSVNHFTPYVVVIDNRPDPLPAPGNFTVGCDNQKTILNWEKIQDDNNIGYYIYSCTSSECTVRIKDIDNVNQLTQEFTASNGVEYCYAISGISGSSLQDENKTSIKCITPDETGCNTGITLLTPANNDNITNTPTFRFTGNGDSDFYILTVKDKNNYVIMSSQTDGELASSSSAERENYSISYSSSTSLVSEDSYTWSVVGYKDGTATNSQTYTFTFQGQGTGCTETLDAPVLISPETGSRVTGTSPTFLWNDVENAEYFILSVLDPDKKLVFETITTSLSASYTTGSGVGTSLIDNKTYTWYVRAANECATPAQSSEFTFTKVADTTAVLNPVQWVIPSEDLRDPINSGDQYVELNWKPNQESNLYGYRIYRSSTPTSVGDLIDTILTSQFGTPPPNDECSTFYTSSPGYCDVSVTNGERYYYRIKAIDDGYTEGPASTAQSITLDLERPVLVAPGSVVGETVTTDEPTFNWLPVNGSNVTYLLTLKDKSNNTVIWQPSTTSNSQNLTTSDVSLKEQNEYSWSVIAVNSLVQSEPSQTFTFTKGATSSRPDATDWCRGTSSSSCAGTGVPPYYEYDKNVANNGITVYWNCVNTAGGSTVNNIEGYYLYRSTSIEDLWNQTAYFISNYECEQQAGTNYPDTSYTMKQLTRGVIYYFGVVAADSGGQLGSQSPILEIRYDLAAPTLLYPAYNQRVYEPEPEFKWLNVDGATQYKFMMDGDGTFQPGGMVWEGIIDNPGGTMITLKFGDSSMPIPRNPLENPINAAFDGKPYSWKVCAINEITTGDTGCSNKFQFLKNLKAPDVQSPANSDFISTDSITFSWTSSPGADHYILRICKENGAGNCSDTANPIIYESEVSETSITLEELNLIAKCDTSLNPNCTDDGLYTWQVMAVDSAGAMSGEWDSSGMGGATSSFTKIGLPAPSLITPAHETILTPYIDEATCTDLYGNTTYNYNLYFSWQAVTEAEDYVFKIVDIKASEAADEEVVIYMTSTSDTFITAGTCAGSPEPIPLSAGREYTWNVAANSAANFTANLYTFSTGLPAPNLTAPTDGKQAILSDNCDGGGGKLCVHFEWNGGSFNGTTQPGVIGASSYDIEIYSQSLQQYFECKLDAEPLVSGMKNVVTTFCDLSNGDDASNSDIFTWRVRARDSSGINTSSGIGYPGPWSQTRMFTVLVPGPVLASPPASSDTCYDDPTVAGVMADCTDMLCMNPEFYWSPIPLATAACYRIEISDTEDFRNLILKDNSEDNSFGTFFKEGGSQGYNAYKANIATPVPMTNGVEYFWRIGASVQPDPAAPPCSGTWIYSDTRSFLKRPNSGLGLTYYNVTHNSVSFDWGAPVNCQGDASDAVSVPGVPPLGGEYVTYLIQGSELPTATSPPDAIYRHLAPGEDYLDIPEGLSEQTPYVFCVAVVDNSFYYTDGGHHGPFECVLFQTDAAPETP